MGIFKVTVRLSVVEVSGTVVVITVAIVDPDGSWITVTVWPGSVTVIVVGPVLEGIVGGSSRAINDLRTRGAAVKVLAYGLRADWMYASFGSRYTTFPGSVLVCVCVIVRVTVSVVCATVIVCLVAIFK
jgi:hypothetical protein